MASKKMAAPPSRFRKVETSLAGFWKPEGAGECLQGIVGPAIEVTTANGLNKFFTLRLTATEGGPIESADDKAVKPELGMIVGVGGKMLAMFLSEREGKEVLLTYRGRGKAKPGQSAPKLFDTYEATTEE